MIDSCHIPKCSEPRTHNLAWCDSHYSLVDKATKGRYEYALSMVQKCREASGPKLDRCVLRLRDAREDVTTAIREALKERESL